LRRKRRRRKRVGRGKSRRRRREGTGGVVEGEKVTGEGEGRERWSGGRNTAARGGDGTHNGVRTRDEREGERA